jgi:hypothetical protein
MTPSSIPRDKLLHFAAGCWFALAGCGLAVWLGLPGYFGALEAALLAGLGREIYNTRTGGKWSTADVGWTVLGAVPVAMTAYVAGFA